MTGTTAESLYETDYYAWTQQQAAELRKLADRRVNTPLDLANLAEEVEDLGKSERDAVRSQIRRIIEHLLKLEFSRSAEPRAEWRESIIDARNTLDDKMTATLRRDVEARLPRLFRQARDKAAAGLERFREFDAAGNLPEGCPYTLDDICRESWYPANRHGLRDGSANGPQSGQPSGSGRAEEGSH